MPPIELKHSADNGCLGASIPVVCTLGEQPKKTKLVVWHEGLGKTPDIRLDDFDQLLIQLLETCSMPVDHNCVRPFLVSQRNLIQTTNRSPKAACLLPGRAWSRPSEDR